MIPCCASSLISASLAPSGDLLSASGLMSAIWTLFVLRGWKRGFSHFLVCEV